DDADLKQLWSELIPLYDYEYDPVKSAAAVEAGIYRHEAHNWCFQHNWGGYDLKADLPKVTVPTLVTVGRRDWVTPVSSSETIASLMPNAELVVFERSGHSPQVEERELFQQTIRDFVDRAVPAGTPA
ncbi:MAG: alpha/beta fold hydrolase, partial [Frankiaceae bacterium]